ncbi:MAG TPA: phosphate ABC transporter permease PstA [Magnetospirillaceae bacterium]|nr:phosphate ABC transporter permease PstA [Magnetospirillaceae bacterium]
MTEALSTAPSRPKIGTGSDAEKRLKARYRAEKRFRAYGLISIAVALSFLVVLLGSIVSRGWSAFTQSEIQLSVTFDAETIDPDGTREHSTLSTADYRAVIAAALEKKFPEIADDRTARRDVQKLISSGAELELRKRVLADPGIIGSTIDLWLPASAEADQVVKGNAQHDESSGLSEGALAKLDALRGAGTLKRGFNTYLFTNGDSRQPEMAGLLGAVVGSFYSLAITLVLSFPLGVAAAVYLEEFASRNRFTDLIEVNINNLAAVPSIVFGLLALEIFLNVLGLPRSAPLVGGLALTLVSLPTIIISARVALKAVPPWIREAAQGLGASRQQMVTHHVLPLAMPGILTGTIIAMARAIGESAPLLMIGMVAFVVDVPATPVDPSTALPVQVYLWAASPERAFVERTSAAILVLLACLAVMNATAIYLRKKFERRW